MLAPARFHPGQQRRLHRIATVQTRRQVRDRDADLDGRPIARAGDVHEPKLGLYHDIVAGALAVGARLPVARHAGVNQARVQLAERVVVELIFGQRAGNKVLD